MPRRRLSRLDRPRFFAAAAIAAASRASVFDPVSIVSRGVAYACGAPGRATGFVLGCALLDAPVATSGVNLAELGVLEAAVGDLGRGKGGGRVAIHVKHFCLGFTDNGFG